MCPFCRILPGFSHVLFKWLVARIWYSRYVWVVVTCLPQCSTKFELTNYASTFHRWWEVYLRCQHSWCNHWPIVNCLTQFFFLVTLSLTFSKWLFMWPFFGFTILTQLFFRLKRDGRWEIMETGTEYFLLQITFATCVHMDWPPPTFRAAKERALRYYSTRRQLKEAPYLSRQFEVIAMATCTFISLGSSLCSTWNPPMGWFLTAIFQHQRHWGWWNGMMLRFHKNDRG